MAQFSFDIVSQINLQEVDNAVNQATKEVAQRYDLKDSGSAIEWNEKETTLTLRSDVELHLKSVLDILQSKLIKRGIHIKALDAGAIEMAGGNTVRQTVKLKQGIEGENAKKITRLIKDSKMKVQAAIQGEEIRVSGKDKDELQTAMTLVKSAEFEFPVQFVNFR